VREITPVELLGQFRKAVTVVAADPEAQLRRCRDEHVPVDEIAQSLEDMIPV
jgi:hypothetical protein